MPLLSFLPAWLSPTLLGALAIACISAFASGLVEHKIDSISYSKIVSEKATLQSDYDGYKASVAVASAQASLKAVEEQKSLQGTIANLQRQLDDQQRISDEKSKQFQAILASAKPGDIRALGPAALSYYDRLRTDAKTGHSAVP